jgi:hypothetical protein
MGQNSLCSKPERGIKKRGRIYFVQNREDRGIIFFACGLLLEI